MINKSKRIISLVLAGLFLFLATPTSLAGETFTVPATIKPYVAYKNLEFKAKDVEYSTKIYWTDSKTNVASLVKEGVSVVFETLYKSLPEESVKAVKDEVYNKIKDSIESLDKTSDKKEIKNAIEDIFSEFEANDAASYKKITWYAYKAAGSIIESGINKIKE
ncbi:MAG: hypothetical protein ChlgKO_03740 [Chlamydiales bacterium]